MNNQVSRLREEISGKELALAKDEQEHKRLDKDNEALKVRSSALRVAAHTLQFSSLICLSRWEGERLRLVDQVCWPVVFPQAELQLMKLQLEETKQRVDSQRAEQQNLQKMLADADAQQVQQKKQTEQVKEEKLWCREEKTWEFSPAVTGKNWLQDLQRARQPGQAAAPPQPGEEAPVREDQDPAVSLE